MEGVEGTSVIALHNFCDHSDCYDVLACCFVGWRLCALTHVLCANAHPHAYVTYSGPRQQLPPDMPCGRGNELRARRHFRPVATTVGLNPKVDDSTLKSAARSREECVCNPFGRFRRKDWHKTSCDSCVELELRSGDILLFNGTKADDIAHGAMDTLAGTGPEGLPPWAQGCRVSLQYRVRTSMRTNVAGAGAGGAGGAGWSWSS